ncbi:cytochrome c3 family protein [Desulfobotulus sp.]|jgi:cytochrome c553|uniref:cytochrome c3 family protein n=1 Tax=Desulfobotulus sp. TaxID=1940337 RepID=UPI002A35B531|nr:cytochrome c3 family protein [Desulfobotulus sp.]MDY0163779.1 cytochrome c3 family protein [Desulfobotulus sp.]
MHPRKKKKLILAVFGSAALLCAAAIALASGPGKTEVSDVIEMKNPIYQEHQRSIVSFTHKKHAEDYGISCGECHHDDKGQPLDLKMGDPVQSCAACHSIPGERPKGKDAPRLSKQERLAYHAEAIHENCISCHREVNQKTGDRTRTPVMCNQCHAR